MATNTRRLPPQGPTPVGQRLRAHSIQGQRDPGPSATEWDYEEETLTMSNPNTLKELADSLAVSAQAAYQRAQDGPSGVAKYEAGYRDALLDTRATVLAIIASGREVVRTVHEYPEADADEVNNMTPDAAARANKAVK